MITEDYVSFETAKLLKEKGFNETCRAFWKDWYHEKSLCDSNTSHCFEYCTNTMLERYNDEDEINISAPTLQMVMKWLREVYNYDISICLDSYVEPYDNEYYIVIRRKKDRFEEISPCEQVYFKTYEQACEAAIKYCLENLI